MHICVENQPNDWISFSWYSDATLIYWPFCRSIVLSINGVCFLQLSPVCVLTTESSVCLDWFSKAFIYLLSNLLNLVRYST